jgi:MFS family permease
LAPIFGPILGGVIIDEASLQWVFVVNLPIATMAIAASRSSATFVPMWGCSARRDFARLPWRGRVSPCALRDAPGAAALRPARARQERAAGAAPSFRSPGV